MLARWESGRSDVLVEEVATVNGSYGKAVSVCARDCRVRQPGGHTLRPSEVQRVSKGLLAEQRLT